MAVTLNQIAKRSGVSTGVVSRVLRGGGDGNVGYSEATRKRVLDVADSLKYQPRATHGIAMIHSTGDFIPESVDWIGSIAPLLSSVNLRVTAAGKRISMRAYTSEDLDADLVGGKLPRVLCGERIDGVIATGQLEPQLLDHLKSIGLPHVLMNASDADRHSVDSICFDELAASIQATEHLLQLGHRRVMYLGYDYGNDQFIHYATERRRQGYEIAMQQAGLEPRKLFHHGVPDSHTQAEDDFDAALLAALQQDHAPTALVCFNEGLALRCLRVMNSVGLSFRGVSLMAIGWQQLYSLEMTGISHVALPALDMGQAAADMLLDKIRSGQSYPTISLRGQLVLRQSTHPCRKQKP